MATPRQANSKNPSFPNGLGRSLPAKTNSHLDENSYGGRPHTSSSVPRTKFTSLTPSSEKEAINKLKKKMTFSDQSTESSARSTPKKNTNLSLSSTRGAATDPMSKRSTSHVTASSAPLTSSYVLDGGRDDGASEGEITSSVSVQDILAKLDSVKNYLKEAESLHRQMQDKISEPGALAQIEKLNKLIEDLRQQETSYLAILLRIMDHNETNSQLDTTQEDSDNESEEGSEYSEDESMGDSLEEGGDPADDTIVSSQDHEEEDDSLSLRAQLSKNHGITPDQEEEIRVLQQQQQMLKDLIEQQTKIKELEEKQAELLRRRAEAQNQLVEAEARTLEYRRLADEAAAKEQEQPHASTDNTETVVNEQETQEDELQLEEDEEDDDASEHRKSILARMAALKARKDRIEDMLDTFAGLNISEYESGDDGEGGEGVESAVSGHSLTASVDQEKELHGASEFVNATDVESDPRMAEVEAKLRQAAEAKRKLAELREMIDSLKDSAGYVPTADTTHLDSEALQWRLSLEPNGGDMVGVVSDSEEVDEEEAQDKTLDTTLDENEGGISLNRSVVADYERSLAVRRQEVADLQQQKEELQLMQEKILAMRTRYLDSEDVDPADVQPSVSAITATESSEQINLDQDQASQDEGEPDLPLHLAQELHKQQELYEEIMSKTKKLKELRTQYEEEVSKISEQDTYSLTSSTRLLTDADLTAATWGGSTVQSDEEGDSDDTASSISVPVATTVHLEGSELAMAGSAALEQQADGAVSPEDRLNFTVTRHTPRHHPPRRALSITDDSPQNVGKKMRLDSEVSPSPAVSGGQSNASGTKAQAPPFSLGASSQFSAVWPGVIFPSGGSRPSSRKDSATQTTTHPPTGTSPNLNSNPGDTTTPGVQSTMDSNVHQSPHADGQLAMMSNMCSELLHGQNTLIHMLCHRMDNMDTGVVDHMNQLHGYHRELQMYYNELCQAHANLPSMQQQAGSQGPQSEVEEPIGAADQENSMPEMSTSGQQEQSHPQPNPYYSSPGRPAMYGYPQHNVSIGGATSSAQGLDESRFEGSQHSGTRPPPPPPMFVPHAGYGPMQSPYYRPRPVYQPGWYSNPSPMRYQSPSVPFSPHYPTQYGVSNAGTPGASMYGSPYGYQPWPQFGPTRYQPQVGSNTSLHRESPRNPFTLAHGDSRDGTHATGPHSAPQFPMQSHSIEIPPRVGDFVLNSPSGITAASVQVQAPSTPPPSAPPSVNMQQSSSSLNNNNNNTSMSATVTGPPTFISGTNANTLVAPQSYLGSIRQNDLPTSVSNESVPRSMSELSASRSLPMLVPVTRSTLSYELLSTMASRYMGNDSTEQTKETVNEKETQPPLEDEESISSLPVSVPEDIEVPQSSSGLLEQAPSSEDMPSGFSVFDALRDTIYSEVATLIANNEARPHFLVELFRELQLLSSDYLRQRALYNIQDLVTRFLTEEGETTPTPGIYQGWVDSISEHTPSESEITTEDDAPKPPLTNTASQGFDYVELVHSASSLSTPPPCASDDHPFASVDLGETVIHLDKAMAKVKEKDDDSTELQPPVVSPGPLVIEEDEENQSLADDYQTMENSEMDTQILDDQIKEIMTEVIPILKSNMMSDCTAQLLDQIKKVILDLVLKQETRKNPDFLEVLSKQLDATVATAMEKYLNRKFKDCGEDMLVDLSEVLFNELSFFRLMQDLRDHPQLSSDFRSVTSSQTTTENEDNVEGDESQAMRSKPLPMDPLLLQALSLEANKTLVEEEEALGKVRDDELANTWDSSVQRQDRSSMSGDDDSALNIVEPSVTEPTNSDKVSEGSATLPSEPPVGDSLPVELTASITNPGPITEAELPKEVAPIATEPITNNTAIPGSETTPNETPKEPRPLDDSDDSTPPTTPVAAHSCGVPTGEGVECQKESGIGSVGGIRVEDDDQPIQQHASSPPGHSLDVTPQPALDVQMKTEQEAVEGIPGIIVTIEEQGQELAGNGDELPGTDFTEP